MPKLNPYAKAIGAGAGASLAAYTAVQTTGHLTWLTLVGSLCAGILLGAITWAVPNTPEPTDSPAEAGR